MTRERFAHLEEHAIKAGDAVAHARIGLGEVTDDKARRCITHLCRAVDELGIVAAALLNEAKPDQAVLTDEQFHAQVVEGKTQP